MDFLQLEYFLTVARMGNMTAAATALHVAQSSVSRSIARLEDDLGVPLFERTGRGIFLNEYGKAFYERAETILRELGDGERQMKEMRDAYAGRISISTSAARQINRLMAQFMEEHPDVLFRQRRMTDLNDIKSKLDSGALDYALTYTPLPDPEYQWEPLIQEEYYVLLPQNHPFSGRIMITLDELKGENLLLNDSDDPDFIDQLCAQRGFKPNYLFIGNEYEVIGPMVERGLGVGIISTLSMYDLKKNLPLERLAMIRSAHIQEDALQRRLGILSRKHHYLSPAAKLFYKKLIDYFHVIELEMS